MLVVDDEVQDEVFPLYSWWHKIAILLQVVGPSPFWVLASIGPRCMQQLNAGIYSTRARWLRIVHGCTLCKLHNCPWLLQDCGWFVQDGVDPRQLALLVFFHHIK